MLPQLQTHQMDIHLFGSSPAICNCVREKKQLPSDWNESLYHDLQERRQEGMWKLPHNCSDLARKQGTLEGTAIVASTCRIQVDATTVRYFHVAVGYNVIGVYRWKFPKC